MQIHATRFPNPSSRHTTIIRDLLEIAKAGYQEALDAIILMLEDLQHNATRSRYLKKLTGISLHELKTKSRGGTKGGARVYLFVINEEHALVINAEVKPEATPNIHKLKEALTIVKAYKEGVLSLEPKLETP